MDPLLYEQTVALRVFEEKLLDLFSAGKLSGTVHTCIGQELNAVAVSKNLRSSDWVFSNHRCHGHYLALHPKPEGLLAEIMGRSSGLCAGRGGSQHICDGRFFSNGIQGGGTPIAAGCALAETFNPGSENISVAYIGDGTLGQGVLYETCNLAALWSLPWLLVVEHNGYAQSTSTATTIAGSILPRFEAFGLKTFATDIWNEESLFATSKEAVEYVRQTRKPAVLCLACYRLKAHSKGDDNRTLEEVSRFLERDPLVVFEKANPELSKGIRSRLDNELEAALARIEASPESATLAVSTGSLAKARPVFWQLVETNAEPQRVVERLRAGLAELLKTDPRSVVIGEDIEDEYGGAFKVSKGLSTQFPGRVRNTPISEAAIAGFGNGLAMAGKRPIVEIMFGDFVTLIADQLINQASKFAYLYNHQVSVPVIVRTPMGGRRGYGATHSQSIEKMFFGTPGLQIFAVNDVFDPALLLRRIHDEVSDPSLVIENKSLYRSKLRSAAINGVPWLHNCATFPTHRLPVGGGTDLTIVLYGGMLEETEKAAAEAFIQSEIRCELVVPTRLQPLDLSPILESVAKTGRLLVVEEGQAYAGFGAELIAACTEALPRGAFLASRCAAAEHPIPCSKDQERDALPQASTILKAILDSFESSPKP